LYPNKLDRWMRWVEAGATLFSTCAKRQYLAVILDEHGHVLGTGYNGGPKGARHCTDGGCPRVRAGSAPGSNYDDCIAIHAEANALLHSDYTVRAAGCTLIVNGPPCFSCAKLAVNGGVRTIVFKPDESYEAWPKVRGFLDASGVATIAWT
jgi:dCMP deaminase